MHAPFGIARSQRQQRLKSLLIEQLGIIHQQINFLTSQCQLAGARTNGSQ